MPLQDQDHNLIEKHLLQQLSKDEQSLYLERLNDPDFKKELDLQSDLMQSFKAEGRAQMKSQLQSFENKIQQDTKPQVASRFSIGRILAVAASIALLVVAGYWAINRAPSNEQLFAQHFESYPNIVAPLDKGIPDEDPVAAAYQTYELGNYADASKLLSALPEQNQTSIFYRGLCELSLNNTAAALQLLDQVNDRTSTVYYPALWYKALTYIKQGNIEKSKPLLQSIQSESNIPRLKNKAEKLLEEL